MDRNTIECAEDQTECVDRYCSILARRDNFPIIVKMCVNERGRLITELLGGFFFDLALLVLQVGVGGLDERRRKAALG